MMSYEEQIKSLLDNPDNMLQFKPFTRGGGLYSNYSGSKGVDIGETVSARLPHARRYEITQEQYLSELDPDCHKVLFDQNIPSITIKTKDGGFAEIEYKRMAIPFQRIIRNKKVQHLCGNPMEFTMTTSSPTPRQIEDFATFKKYWKRRNQDGMIRKMVSAQLSCGLGGLLYYFDRNGQIKSRPISFLDGFIICSHNDQNGDRIMECVYYCVDDVEHIDAYTDKDIYLFERGAINDGNWTLKKIIKHGFNEIPLITKRGQVAWDNVQNIIEVYEVMYNIFMVIQKRHGWGILYIKGRFSQEAQKIAGAIILNDTSMDGTGSADFKTPPNPQGMIDSLKELEKSIQKGSGATFILPEDINFTGDISGIAIQVAQSLDLEEAESNAADYQNVVNKAERLFQFGLSKELANKGIQKNAMTDFESLDIYARLKVWRPQSETEYNNMLIALRGSKLISEKTGIEKNTVSSPDEEMRRQKEIEEEMKAAELNAQQQSSSQVQP